MTEWLISIVGTVTLLTIALMLMDVLDFGISVDGFWTALMSGFSIAVMNFLIRLVIFSLKLDQPATQMTVVWLIVAWLVAAVILYFIAWLRRGFEIENYLAAMIGVFVMGLLIVGMQTIAGLFFG
ncbi:MAG: phage holin family protein [Anaerolineae bacterium]